MTSFFNAAVEAKLNAEETAGRDKPWMAFSGILSGQKREAKRIMDAVEESCEQVNPADWT